MCVSLPVVSSVCTASAPRAIQVLSCVTAFNSGGELSCCAVRQSGAARFPVRHDRDLSGYVPDGSMGAGGIATQLVIPPGTSDEDRRAIEAAQV